MLGCSLRFSRFPQRNIFSTKNVYFSSAAAEKKVSANEFGSLHRSDVRVEKLEKPRLRVAPMDEIAARQKPIHTIATPVGMSQKRMEVLRAKQEFQNTVANSKKVIECSKREFDQYEDMRFPPGVRIPLCSEFWEKNKYKDHWFTIKRRTKAASSSILHHYYSWEDFAPDKIDLRILETLKAMKLKGPLGIQTQCLQSFSTRNHLFIAAETGSGKTLAYAVPLLSSMMREKRKGRGVKAVIVLATNGLKEQTYDVIQKLATDSGIRIAKCEKKGTTVEKKSEDWDVLIGTPGLVEEELQNMEDPRLVTQMVFDEADMLLDESFADCLTEIFSIVPVAHSVTNQGRKEDGARLIFCSASCPEELECLAEAVVERTNLSYIRSHRLHSLMNNVEMTFLRVREQDKLDRLQSILEKDLKKGDRNQSIVFCKDRRTSSFVFESLTSRGLQPILWTSSTTLSPETQRKRVIVASDVAARGLDLPYLSHVINYDMARHTVDFLHRCGRVGRLGSIFPGYVTSFIRTTPQVQLTNVIELAARLGKPLTSVETDISAMLRRKREEKEENEEEE